MPSIVTTLTSTFLKIGNCLNGSKGKFSCLILAFHSKFCYVMRADYPEQYAPIPAPLPRGARLNGHRRTGGRTRIAGRRLERPPRTGPPARPNGRLPRNQILRRNCVPESPRASSYSHLLMLLSNRKAAITIIFIHYDLVLYRSLQITQLKIASNPFAKGFRDCDPDDWCARSYLLAFE